MPASQFAKAKFAPSDDHCEAKRGCGTSSATLRSSCARVHLVLTHPCHGDSGYDAINLRYWITTGSEQPASSAGSKHEHIAPEHLLLGMLREKDSDAAVLLCEYGAELERIRKGLAA